MVILPSLILILTTMFFKIKVFTYAMKISQGYIYSGVIVFDSGFSEVMIELLLLSLRSAQLTNLDLLPLHRASVAKRNLFSEIKKAEAKTIK